MSKKKWMGSEPIRCDLCGQPFKKFFIDGKTTFGPWGLLCEDCHGNKGVGLGEGKGQKYDLKTKIKVEG